MPEENRQSGIHQDLVPIEFDEKTHTYKVGGKTLPSVTQIIKAMSQSVYSGIPERVMEEARDRGIRVHRAVEMFEKYGAETEDDEIKPYLLSYKIAKRVEGIEVIFQERKMTNGRFCGTIDMYATINVKGTRKKVLIDIKATSTIHDNLVAVQLGGYNILMDHYEYETEGHYCLQLKKTGYKFKEVGSNKLLFECMLDGYEEDEAAEA